MDWLAFVVRLLPTILRTISQVENIIKGSQKGPEKKALVVDSAATLASTAGVPPAEIPTVKTAVASLVDTQVAALNKAGIFKSEPRKQPTHTP